MGTLNGHYKNIEIYGEFDGVHINTHLFFPFLFFDTSIYTYKLIMLKYVAEFLGTFFFVSVVLNAGKAGTLAPIAVVVGLLAAIFLVSSISGAHLNGTISTVMYLDGKLSSQEFGAYVASQLAGAVLALYVTRYLNRGSLTQ